jgi:2-dehydrotetronate isomerase
VIASAAGRTIGPGTARGIDEGNRRPFAAAADGIAILIEALNDRNNPGYFITHQLEAVEIVRRVDRPNVAVQPEYYHAQIMDGDLTSLTERMAGSFGHVQIVSVRGRHEPDRGEIRYGHGGWIGCDYHPAGATEAGLDWFREHF